MFTMLVALTYGAASISAEREGGLLRRLASTPLTAAEIVAGKLLGRLAVAGLQVTVFALVGEAGRRLFDLEITNLPAAWVVLLVFALTVAPLGLVVGGLFRDPDRAASVGVIVTVVMAALGGCWWPIEVVSPTLQRVALALPTGWAMRALHDVLSFGHPLVASTPSLLVLLGFALLFTVVGVKTLRVD
jgi:ABC-type multidrug transport system permease subunit